jgi:hypothetical protein
MINRSAANEARYSTRFAPKRPLPRRAGDIRPGSTAHLRQAGFARVERNGRGCLVGPVHGHAKVVERTTEGRRSSRSADGVGRDGSSRQRLSLSYPGQLARTPYLGAGILPVLCSSRWASHSGVRSSNIGPMSCTPTGRLLEEDRPAGIAVSRLGMGQQSHGIAGTTRCCSQSATVWTSRSRASFTPHRSPRRRCCFRPLRGSRWRDRR